MIKKWIEFIKNDYSIVSGAVHDMFKFKVPEWAIVIWYILMLPIGYALVPFVKIYFKILMWRLERNYTIKNK